MYARCQHDAIRTGDGKADDDEDDHAENHHHGIEQDDAGDPQKDPDEETCRIERDERDLDRRGRAERRGPLLHETENGRDEVAKAQQHGDDAEDERDDLHSRHDAIGHFRPRQQGDEHRQEGQQHEVCTGDDEPRQDFGVFVFHDSSPYRRRISKNGHPPPEKYIYPRGACPAR